MGGHTIKRIVPAALLAALTTAATLVIRIPTPTLGYIHPGDGMVLLCGILLGPGLGAAAAGLGSMLADLLGGFPAWAPGTLAIKALTALVSGALYRLFLKRAGISAPLQVILCGIPAEALMVAGYFLYEVGMLALSGSALPAASAAALTGIPFNGVQGGVGVAVCALLLPILRHAGAGAGRYPRNRSAGTR
jgi:uncharacterized membrane protein